MQVSYAQRAAHQFGVFATPDQSSTRLHELVQQPHDEAIDFGSLRYLSDWFHLWLLSGEAHEVTFGDAGVYLQALVIATADFIHDRESFLETVTSIFPPPGGSDNEEWIETPSYVIPMSVTPEYYAITAKYSDVQRSQKVRSFLTKTIQSRQEP